ncbi:MAG: hypothetical protein OXC97_01510 [Candidatus Dadabacteria bacterium]|nr:hypothetical protein [Candidatus Dadabacteria bacterium]
MQGETQASKNPDHQIINRYITLCEQELEVDRRKVDARINEQNNMKEVAIASIAAQKEDRQESRKISQLESKNNRIFILIIVAIFVGFLVFAILQNHIDLAKQIATYSFTVIISAFGGYGYAIKRMGSMSTNLQE